MQTHRRQLLGFSAATLAVPSRAWAQAAGRHYRIGWFSVSSHSAKEPYSLAFVQRLAELGFVEGRNLTIERRHADNRLERVHAAAAELGKLKCDAYFSGGNEANLSALTQASPHTPIVFVAVDFDPVATGDVASLARPGGRVTGITALQSELPAKRLEILKEMLPSMTRVALLANEQTGAQVALVQGTARRIGLAVQLVDLKRAPFDFPGAFTEMVRGKADGLFVTGSSLWVPSRQLIPELALKARLPTMFHQAQWVEAGGLMSYGFNFVSMYRRSAEMLAAVLRGAKPGTMPMEQPTIFELAINMRTAKTLGIKVPQTLLVRAERIIE